MQQHAPSFIAHTEASTGAELPRFIKDEFDAFSNAASWHMDSSGCAAASADTTSCWRSAANAAGSARYAAPGACRKTTAHLVDHVIPHVRCGNGSCRCWSRYACCWPRSPSWSRRCCRWCSAWSRGISGAAGLRADEGHGGSVTLIHRLGSAANLNIHLHCLVLDHVYRCGADAAPAFVEAGTPTNDELQALLQTVLTLRGAMPRETPHASAAVCRH